MCEKEHLIKLEKYCAYQERCHQEVRLKAQKMGIARIDVDEAMLHLIKNNFLNEERFAMLFARSKMNQKRWGPIKIEIELRKKQIGQRLIEKSIGEISPVDFQKNANYLANKFIASKSLDLKNYIHTQKLRVFLVSKGYSFDLINKILLKL